MLLEQRVGGARVVQTEARFAEFGSSIPPTWAQISGGLTPSGKIINAATVVTIPTIVGGVHFMSAAVAALPVIVYRGLGEEKTPQYESWQYVLLETFPGLYTDPFQLKFDINYCLETCGNAFVLKVKDPKSGQVVELILLDPDRVAIRNDKGEKKFDIRVDRNHVFKGATPNEIMHVKMLPKAGSLFTGTCGLQLITGRLGVEMSSTEWEGRFFQNDATPPLVITLGEDAGVDEMKEAYESWMQTHGGAVNAGKPAVIAGGAKIEKLGFNLNEAQMDALHNFNVMEFARAMNMPLSLFIPPHTKPASAEDEALLLSTFYLGPRLRRIESAINSDPDFFAYNDMWCRFDERQMMRANTVAMATAFHNYLQDGALVPDEVRAELGYGPLPELPMGDEAIKNPGKIPQITPVGGAPNDVGLDQQVVNAVEGKGSDE